MNTLAQIDTHYSNLVALHAVPMHTVAGKKNWTPNQTLLQTH
jgi:hypothetical protein